MFEKDNPLTKIRIKDYMPKEEVAEKVLTKKKAAKMTFSEEKDESKEESDKEVE